MWATGVGDVRVALQPDGYPVGLVAPYTTPSLHLTRWRCKLWGDESLYGFRSADDAIHALVRAWGERFNAA